MIISSRDGEQLNSFKATAGGFTVFGVTMFAVQGQQHYTYTAYININLL